jgi:hypothetical protein
VGNLAQHLARWKSTTSSSLIGSEAPKTKGTSRLRQNWWDGDNSLGVTEGEPSRTEETEACEQSRLSMVVVESTKLDGWHRRAQEIGEVAGEKAYSTHNVGNGLW